MRLLAITNDFPLPLDRGGPVRCFGLARALGQAHDVHFLAVRRSGTTDGLVAELADAIGGPVEVFEAPVRREGWARAIRRGVPPWVAQQHSQALQHRALELVPGMDAVAILDDYAAIYAPALAPSAPVVCDKHNVLAASATISPPGRGLRGVVHRQLSIHLSRRFERRHLAAATSVVVTSAEERERLRSLYGIEAAAVVPSAVDIPPRAVEPRGERVVGWLGSHEYNVNVDGLLRFVGEAWEPLGREGYSLLVAGGSPPPAVRELERLPGIEVLGYVDDLEEFLSRLGAAVVPLWRGPGVKLKTLTFMGAGVPTVSTTVGVEGIEGLHDRHYLIADDPAGLATQIVRALEEPGLGPTLRREGRRLIAERYTWEHLGPRFVEAVEAAQRS